MKFEIQGTDFKKAVDRVGIVVTKKSSIPVYSTVRIEAKENVITISAATLEQVVELVVSDASKDIYSDILEEGFCFVNLEKLKKIYNIKDKILVSSDENNLTLKATKKKCSIPCSIGIEYDDMLACFKNLNTNVVDILRMKESKFVRTLTDLKSLIEINEYRKILTAIHLSANRKRLSVVGGVMCAERKIDEEFFVNEGSYHIPQEVATHLNKISNKGDNLVTIKANDKIIEIDGEDYVYKSRLIKDCSDLSLHSSVDKIVDACLSEGDDVTNGAYSFNINAAEWIEIAKEYSTLNKASKEDKAPMILYLSGNKLKTYIHSEIETSDCIKISNVKTDCQNDEILTLCGVNPKYLLKILSLFKYSVDKVTVSGVSAKGKNGRWDTKRPIKVCNDKYTCILMSMSILADYVNQSRKFLSEEKK